MQRCFFSGAVRPSHCRSILASRTMAGPEAAQLTRLWAQSEWTGATELAGWPYGRHSAQRGLAYSLSWKGIGPQLALVVGTLPICHPAYITLHHLWRKPTQARIKSRINPDHNSVSCWRNRQSSPQSFQYQPCLQGIDWTQLNPHGGAIDEVPTVGAWSREYSRLLKYCDALLRCC